VDAIATVSRHRDSDPMTAIIPRWEWRTFAPRLPMADEAFAGLQPSGVAETDEVYFLSGPKANVKIRDGLADIKLLHEVDADGLQRWEPVLKRPFPLSPADLAAVLGALGVAARGAASDTTQDAFLEIVDHAGTRIVPVHKRRVRYTVGGCMAERSEVEAAGRRWLTVAVESTDRDAVRPAVESLGLGDFLNTSYPIGLGLVVDDAPARFAVIDVGTNSIKFHVGELGPDGTPHTVLDRAEVTRLGEGVSSGGPITEDAFERSLAAFGGMVDEAKGLGAWAIAAVGTEVLRHASNAHELSEVVKARTGVRLEVIPGDEEGRLAYLAVKSGIGLVEGTLVVFDTGGGSSQFTFGEGTRVDERFSVPVGAARFTEQFGLDAAVPRATVDEAMAAIAADLGRLDGRPSPSMLVGMGGAITNITAVKHGLATYDPAVVQGTTLDRDEIDRQIERYRSTDADGRRMIVGLQPKRAEVILAGACIVRTVMEKLGKDRLTVSDRGLRHGLLVDRFAETRVNQ
jgi:exopolyphosphatase/guanosine-5'-triphosphate,3'-diphosphate pyrophosphatase